MASLNYFPCTATLSHTPSRPTFPKPPSHRLQISSSISENKNIDIETNSNSQPKVDRRNMLLGLSSGSLYGAANLVINPRESSATPIQAPVLDSCGVATNLNNNKELDINCCPPTTDRIVDYRVPPVFQMKMRPSAHRVSPEYIFKYNMAIDRMKRLPKDDPRNFFQQANIHCAYCNGAYKQQEGQDGPDPSKFLQVHNSWLFFPFHRWYLYFYERILGKLINDPTFALPFWNWDNPKGMTIPPMFLDERSALYDKKRNKDSMPPAVVDLGLTDIKDPLQLVTNNLTIMYNEMIRGNSDVYGFMGKAYSQGDAPDRGPGSVERGSHTSVHWWVGDPNQPTREDLGNFYSAGRDPLFYCHHANVDRMWTLWQYFIPSNKVPYKRITETDFLNASFLFYDENAQLVRVTVQDCLDNLRMGYEFERIDLPWLDYRPPPQTVGARIRRANTKSAQPNTVFPLKLDQIVRVFVQKTKKGKADEVLVLEDMEVDTSKLLKFDVFVNDEDDNVFELDKAAYLGTYAQLPHKSATNSTVKTSISLKLTDLYDDMDNIDDDETVLVTLVPRHQGEGITIGGIKIIEAPPPAKKPAA
ncbi:hypothetical protein RD792_006499 [Penstemon davidsonii]|uniref:Tyrosinase copper-binding domain-containing protein n=1 Tax=Penstemon davidsonii TaxID=160366 RepID=A0ABR0DDY3_9LAMI|nr:hypothetical protein RD792_006499 [Penstemon davidsonii]